MLQICFWNIVGKFQIILEYFVDCICLVVRHIRWHRKLLKQKINKYIYIKNLGPHPKTNAFVTKKTAELNPKRPSPSMPFPPPPPHLAISASTSGFKDSQMSKARAFRALGKKWMEKKQRENTNLQGHPWTPWLFRSRCLGGYVSWTCPWNFMNWMFVFHS